MMCDYLEIIFQAGCPPSNSLAAIRLVPRMLAVSVKTLYDKLDQYRVGFSKVLVPTIPGWQNKSRPA